MGDGGNGAVMRLQGEKLLKDIALLTYGGQVNS